MVDSGRLSIYTQDMQVLVSGFTISHTAEGYLKICRSCSHLIIERWKPARQTDEEELGDLVNRRYPPYFDSFC